MKITKTSINKPPRITLYGEHGIGKSTFAASCPAPIFIRTEDGADSLGVFAFELATSALHVDSALDHLLTSEHEFKTLVIDSLDWLEKLIFEKVCQIKGVENIGDLPFGRGYALAETEWKNLLHKVYRLNSEKKMLVVFLAHAQIKRFEAPETDSYDRYQLDLQNKAAALVCEFSDIVAFAATKAVTQKEAAAFGTATVKAKSTGERLMYLDERPAFTAKNRYDLPFFLPLSWQALSGKLKEAKKKGGNLTEVVEAKIEKDLEKITNG